MDNKLKGEVKLEANNEIKIKERKSVVRINR